MCLPDKLDLFGPLVVETKKCEQKLTALLEEGLLIYSKINADDWTADWRIGEKVGGDINEDPDIYVKSDEKDQE